MKLYIAKLEIHNPPRIPWAHMVLEVLCLLSVVASLHAIL